MLYRNRPAKHGDNDAVIIQNVRYEKGALHYTLPSFLGGGLKAITFSVSKAFKKGDCFQQRRLNCL